MTTSARQLACARFHLIQEFPMVRSRLSLAVVALVGLGSAATANAADIGAAQDPKHADAYEPRIGMLFVPTEDVTLIPSSMCPVGQGGGDNAALNCAAGLTEETTYTVSADDALVTSLTDALAPYNVTVVTERPPEYVPYSMLIVQDGEAPKSISYTCVGAAIDCDGPNRNEIAFTNGGTANCDTPDVLMTTLIAFGYMSGLENNDNPMDPMFYPPDFTMPVMAFDDTCSNLVPTLDEEMMPNNLACPMSYH
jgi:hypothetical protein